MRIYNLDGTYIDHPFDVKFGWKLSEIVIDEAVPDFEARNRDKVVVAQLQAEKSEREDEESEESEESSEDDWLKVEKVEKHEPKIKISNVQDVVECKLDVEGYNLWDESVAIDLNAPAKSKLTNLIFPYNYEAKLLLSIISLTAYKNVQHKPYTDIFSVVNLRTTNYKRLFNYVSRNEFDDYSFLHEFQYNNNESDIRMAESCENLSLMMELILKDNNCNFNGENERQNKIESVDGNGAKMMENGTTHYLQLKNNYAMEEHVDKSLEYVCKETYEIRLLVTGIRRTFEVGIQVLSPP